MKWSSSRRDGSARLNAQRVLAAASARAARRLSACAEAFEPRLLLALTTIGAEIPVNQFVTGAQADTSIAADADGEFVVAWQSAGQDGSGYGVYARRYNAV